MFTLSLLYSGKAVVAEFLGFTLCIAYLLFLFVYFKQYEETREAEQQIRLIELQSAQSQKEIEANRRSQYAVSLIRHDMRHFLTNISVHIDNGEYEKAKEYINEIIKASDKTAMHKYCENPTVNMILSSYESTVKITGLISVIPLRFRRSFPFRISTLPQYYRTQLKTPAMRYCCLKRSKDICRSICECGTVSF